MIEISSFKKTRVKGYARLQKELQWNYPDFYHPSAWNILLNFIAGGTTLVELEYPYYDRDYLSTYYMYYAKKNRSYSKECLRLHIYNGGDYLGYFVLRPTNNQTIIGKSYLKPKLFLTETAYLLTAQFRVDVLGEDATIFAFPWMKQETDVAVCSHVAIWSILRYYANQYHYYADPTMGEIIEKVPDGKQRRIPKISLTETQVIDVFKSMGFTPLYKELIFRKQSLSFSELCAYIESGHPIACGVKRMHMVSVMGHGTIHYKKLSDFSKMERNIRDNVVLHSELIDTVIVCDDAVKPYLEVKKRECVNPYEEETYYVWSNTTPYVIEDFDCMIVPLKEDIQYDYTSLYDKLDSLLKVNQLVEMGKQIKEENSIIKETEQYVVRIYLAQASKLKRNVKHLTMNETYQTILLGMTLPKIVWCVDISTVDEYKHQKMSIRLIADTTCCNIEDQPWLFLQTPYAIMYLDEGDWYYQATYCGSYDMFQSNLEEVVV